MVASWPLAISTIGKACLSLALGVVARAFGEVSLLIIFVAFGFADGNRGGQIQAAQKAFEIGGILPGRINAHVKMRLGMLLL